MSEPDQSVTELANDPCWVFAQIRQRLTKCKVANAQLRLNEHVRAVTGKNNILAFYQNGSAKEVKLKVLGECLTAIISGDFSKLQGATPAGQAARNDPFADIKPEPVPEPPPVAVVSPEVAKAFGMDQMPPALVKITPDADKKRAAMQALLDEICNPQPAPVVAAAAVDPEEVRRLVNEVCASHVKEQMTNIRGEIADRIKAIVPEQDPQTAQDIAQLRVDISALRVEMHQFIRDSSTDLKQSIAGIVRDQVRDEIAKIIKRGLSEEIKWGDDHPAD